MSISSVPTSLLRFAACLFILAVADAAVHAQATSTAAESHVSMGYQALKEDRYDTAILEFRTALSLDPSLTLRARFPLAVALFEDHKRDEARREFKAVQQVVGDHPNVLYYLGRLDIDAHNFSAAIPELEQASTKPPFPDTAYYLGFAYFKQGQLAEAAKWLEQAAKLNAHDARVFYQLGLVYRQQGREEDAKRTIARSEAVRRQSSEDSRLRLECSQKLDKGVTPDAIALCDQLYDENDPDKLTELGSIYGQHGLFQQALKPLRRAAELSPQSPQTQYNLALTYFQLHSFQEARVPLETALKRWPDLFPLNSLYGAVLVNLGSFPDGQRALQHAHELNPQDPATANLLYSTDLQLAQQNQAVKQYLRAVPYLKEAANLRPHDPAPHQRLAEIYLLIGRKTEAATEKEEAARLAGNPAAD